MSLNGHAETTPPAREAVLAAIRSAPCPDGGGVPTERVVQVATRRSRRVSRASARHALETLAKEGQVYQNGGEWREGSL